MKLDESFVVVFFFCEFFFCLLSVVCFFNYLTGVFRGMIKAMFRGSLVGFIILLYN